MCECVGWGCVCGIKCPTSRVKQLHLSRMSSLFPTSHFLMLMLILMSDVPCSSPLFAQDVHVLRDYAAAAITLMQGTFTASLQAFQDGPAAAQEDWVVKNKTGMDGPYIGKRLPAASPVQVRLKACKCRCCDVGFKLDAGSGP